MSKPTDAAPTARVSFVGMWLLLLSILLMLSSEFWFCDEAFLSNCNAGALVPMVLVEGSDWEQDPGGDNDADTVDDDVMLFLVSTSELGVKAAQRVKPIRLLSKDANDAFAIFVVVAARDIRVRTSNEGVVAGGEKVNENPFVVCAIVTTTTSKINVLDSVDRIPLVYVLPSRDADYLARPLAHTIE